MIDKVHHSMAGKDHHTTIDTSLMKYVDHLYKAFDALTHNTLLIIM